MSSCTEHSCSKQTGCLQIDNKSRSHLPTGMAKKNSEYMGVRFSSSNISAISVGAIVEYDASPMPTSARKIMNTQ